MMDVIQMSIMRELCFHKIHAGWYVTNVPGLELFRLPFGSWHIEPTGQIFPTITHAKKYLVYHWRENDELVKRCL